MSVFHLDVDAFATNLERLQRPELAKRPLVIAPPKARSTVLAASQDAKDLGIAKHMDLSRIRRDFPGILVRPPNFQLYNKAHGDLLAIAARYSPTVEPIRFGHVAMDMMGMGSLLGDLESAALNLCKNVEEHLGLAMTVGIASNKLVSTIAAKETQKNREPLYRVPRDREADFLSPLPCRALPEWDDAKVRRLLFELNLRRIGQIQAIPRHIFGFAIGKLGLRLHRHAEGIDGSPVVPPFNTACLAQAHRFVPDTNDDSIIQATLYQLTEKLCFQLRAKCIGSGTARVLLKYSDGIIRNQLIHFPPTQRETGGVLFPTKNLRALVRPAPTGTPTQTATGGVIGLRRPTVSISTLAGETNSAPLRCHSTPFWGNGDSAGQRSQGGGEQRRGLGAGIWGAESGGRNLCQYLGLKPQA